MVYSIDGYTITKDGCVFVKSTGKPVKIFKSNKYLQCCVFDENGKKHVVGIHTLVARVHCKDWFEGCVVHHKDNNQHNNHADNLECLSLREHVKLHQPKKYKDKIMICPVCQSQFVWSAKSQKHFQKSRCVRKSSVPFCSVSCATKMYFYNGTLGNLRPIKCVETNKAYASCAEASRETNICYKLIYDVVRGKHKSTHGMHFVYV